MVFSGFQPDGHNEGALVRAGYHCSGLILQDHPVDATVDNAGMNAGLMVAIVLRGGQRHTGVANSSTREPAIQMQPHRPSLRPACAPLLPVAVAPSITSGSATSYLVPDIDASTAGYIPASYIVTGLAQPVGRHAIEPTRRSTLLRY